MGNLAPCGYAAEGREGREEGMGEKGEGDEQLLEATVKAIHLNIFNCVAEMPSCKYRCCVDDNGAYYQVGILYISMYRSLPTTATQGIWIAFSFTRTSVVATKSTRTPRKEKNFNPKSCCGRGIPMTLLPR